jgi:hypothetical protein
MLKRVGMGLQFAGLITIIVQDKMKVPKSRGSELLALPRAGR